MKHGDLIVVIWALMNVLFIAVFDIFAWTTVGREATISHIVGRWSQSWPIIPFLAGLLIAHLIW